MKPNTILAPILLATTVMAWGRGTTNESTSYDDGLDQPAEERRYDYKQSMKKPFMYNGAIPFWSHHGNSFVAQDFIRLAPSVPRLHGSVWRSNPNEYKEWEVEFSFKAHGQSFVGGKGLAFWYTEERATEGNLFGNKERWNGLGVFMDTSDPVNQRLTPLIFGFLNDGRETLPSNHADNKFGGCLRDYKNSVVPTVVRVSYIGRTLKVSTDTINKGKKMITCFENKNVYLPTGHYFGFSAYSSETGTPDDHDLYSFEVYEVNPPAVKEKHMRPNEAEMIKKGKEVKVDEKDRRVFEDVQKAVQEEEQRIQEEIDGPNTISSTQILGMVGETQFRMSESLKTIHRKLESLGAPMQSPQSTAGNLADVNEKLDLLVSSLKSMEGVVKGMVEHLLEHAVAKDGHDVTKLLKDELKTPNPQEHEIDSRQSYQHLETRAKLVKSTSWVTYIVFVIVAQSMALAGYNWYKKKLAWNEKKFV
ncbi:hypothetical protein BGZ49_004585 [Haplosporangium sp. Z 27]|nr:hypothetical protein BGZ49_004585 [Haplosporangium sp. Z 27]